MQFFIHHAYKNGDGQYVVNNERFRGILVDLNILMSHDSYKLLWRAVDVDLSGRAQSDSVVCLWCVYVCMGLDVWLLLFIDVCCLLWRAADVDLSGALL